MQITKRLRSCIYAIPVLLSLLFIQYEAFAQLAVSNKLQYQWYPPDSVARFPAVLVLGGSEGGLKYGQQWAKLLTKKGYGVMALAYFGAEGLPLQLEEIPYEYFQAALDTLKALPGVETDQLAIIGVSKGTEAALLLASENQSIRLVIAASPSHVVWQGINRANYSSTKSSWTKGGKPMPFVAYDFSKGYYPLLNFYLGALAKPIDEQAVIPIEKSRARVVLFSGGQDQIWPASAMSAALQQRLLAKKPAIQVQRFDYPQAGHGFLIPFQSEAEKKKILIGMEPNLRFLGGTLDAFDQAMTESLKTVLLELTRLKNE